MRFAGIAAAALVTLAPYVRAQDSLAFLSADRETTAQLTRILEVAREKGLPTDPIVAKARQGALLRTPPARIVAAAQAVVRRLEEARDALAPSPTVTDIAAGQDALSINGVTKEMLKVIRAARPNRPVAVPIGVMAQLVASGVRPTQAAEIVAKLVRNKANDVQLVALGNDVNGDVARGAKADASLNVRLSPLTPFLAPHGAGAATEALTASPGAPRKP